MGFSFIQLSDGSHIFLPFLISRIISPANQTTFCFADCFCYLKRHEWLSFCPLLPYCYSLFNPVLFPDPRAGCHFCTSQPLIRGHALHSVPLLLRFPPVLQSLSDSSTKLCTRNIHNDEQRTLPLTCHRQHTFPKEAAEGREAVKIWDQQRPLLNPWEMQPVTLSCGMIPYYTGQVATLIIFLQQ